MRFTTPVLICWSRRRNADQRLLTPPFEFSSFFRVYQRAHFLGPLTFCVSLNAQVLDKGLICL